MNFFYIVPKNSYLYEIFLKLISTQQQSIIFPLIKNSLTQMLFANKKAPVAGILSIWYKGMR